MINPAQITEISKAWHAEEFAVIRWVEETKPDPELLSLALAQMDVSTGFHLICSKLALHSYLIDYPELTKNIWSLTSEFVKSLDEEVFEIHSQQLTGNDAAIFTILRFATKKADIKFAIEFPYRKIMHHSYEKAVRKLLGMAKQYQLKNAA